MAGTDILIYVEDPGAANFVAGLPRAIRERGLRVKVLAYGKAVEQLAALNEAFETHLAACDDTGILDKLSPRILVVGTSENVDSPAFAMIDQARRLGISSVGLVDGPSNADHRFRGRTGQALGHAPDWIIVADEMVRAKFLALGARDDQVLVGGHPRYDAVLEQGKVLAGCDRDVLRRQHFAGVPVDEKVVVFLSELSDGVNPHLYRRMPDYTLAGRGDVDGRTEIVLEEVLDALAGLERRPHLVVRLHPKNNKGQFAAWEDEIDAFSVGGGATDLLEMLYAADLVVGLTTILMMEAALAGCRTLSVLPRSREADWLPSIGLGLTACASDRDALQGIMKSVFGGKPIPDTKPAIAVSSGALDRVAGILCGLSVSQGQAAC